MLVSEPFFRHRFVTGLSCAVPRILVPASDWLAHRMGLTGSPAR